MGAANTRRSDFSIKTTNTTFLNIKKKLNVWNDCKDLLGFLADKTREYKTVLDK